MTDMAAAQVTDRNGCLAASRLAGHTHSSRARICWTWLVASTISCSRRAPRCRSRPQISPTGSGT
jgi:hypothetical protein